MIGIDLFAGSGGMSLGARWAGIDVQVAVEKDKYAAQTYRRNHKDTHTIVSCITKVNGETLRNLIKGNRPLIILGGPPCQGFSTSNQRNRTRDNKNNWLFTEFFRVVEEILPTWVIFENVKGIIETDNGYFLNKIYAEFERLGYETSWEVLNASDIGVPQNRSRCFLIGNKFKKRLSLDTYLRSQVTVEEAISDLPYLENGASLSKMPYRERPISFYARMMRGELDQCENNLVTHNNDLILRRYRHIPQGGNWRDIPPRLMKNYKDRNRCHTGIYHRLKADSVSVVIGNYRKNMLIHPTQDRGLSVREAARLQSFPDWYVFEGSIGFQQQQVGNAVPPLLAKFVFEKILAQG